MIRLSIAWATIFVVLLNALLRDDFTGLQTSDGGLPGLVGLWPNMAVTVIDDRLAVKLGSSFPWHPGHGWKEKPVCWGRDLAIWTRC